MNFDKDKNSVTIDADGCPVTKLACRIAREYGIRCVVVCDSAHYFDPDSLHGALVKTVSQGADSADLYIVNSIKYGDIVITQDYGLAALCLSRNAAAVDQNGRIYSDLNIPGLLESRAANKELLRSGKHPKGAKKRKRESDTEFEKTLRRIIENGEA